MTLISLELVDALVNLNIQVLNHKIIHPRELAAALEKVAEDAWLEVENLALTQNSDNLAPSLRIDP
ncbi:hypothetical protein CAL7716_023870 [Calothrix sp. PCC 7716]|nr:hypothetical protein CAL7716_023870 [Calothrix sp. PCC 7716]